MDVIESHAAQLPAIDERWTGRVRDREELIRGLLEGRIAGPSLSHPLDNVLRNIRLLCEGEPDKQFGMSGLPGLFTPPEVLGLVGRAAGFTPDPDATAGPVPVDPELVIEACEAVGERLALACARGERVILATGHPVGLAHLYTGVGRQLAARGVELLRPYEAMAWRDADGHGWQVRYLEGVALLTDRASARHTHRGDAMARMLGEERPDLVFADHGFAGAAIESGVETLSIADVNDPALLVARAQGRTETVIVMDDNVQPDAYWPCYQAIVGRLAD